MPNLSLCVKGIMMVEKKVLKRKKYLFNQQKNMGDRYIDYVVKCFRQKIFTKNLAENYSFPMKLPYKGIVNEFIMIFLYFSHSYPVKNS